MANRGRPTQTKRQARARAAGARAHESGAARRGEDPAAGGPCPAPTDHDPDIAGMVPGPQAMPDWQREYFEEEQRAKEAAEKAAQEGG